MYNFGNIHASLHFVKTKVRRNPAPPTNSSSERAGIAGSSVFSASSLHIEIKSPRNHRRIRGASPPQSASLCCILLRTPTGFRQHFRHAGDAAATTFFRAVFQVAGIKAAFRVDRAGHRPDQIPHGLVQAQNDRARHDR